MKKFLLLLIGLFISVSVMSQHRYLATVKVVNQKVADKTICEIFTDLGATKCEASGNNDYLIVETKKFLPRVIVEDHFISQGYEVILFVEMEIKPTMYVIPAKKDTVK